MKKIYIKIYLILVLTTLAFSSSLNTGEEVFRSYCWGCHHETAVAFGPSFRYIANKRDKSEIQGHIISPKSTYKQLGYKRSVMPSFGDTLSQKELKLITSFIFAQKGVK